VQRRCEDQQRAQEQADVGRAELRLDSDLDPEERVPDPVADRAHEEDPHPGQAEAVADRHGVAGSVEQAGAESDPGHPGHDDEEPRVEHTMPGGEERLQELVGMRPGIEHHAGDDPAGGQGEDQVVGPARAGADPAPRPQIDGCSSSHGAAPPAGRDCLADRLRGDPTRIGDLPRTVPVAGSPSMHHGASPTAHR
jgi:hypothetical protein